MVGQSVTQGTWCSWLSRSLSMSISPLLREVLGSIPNVSILFCGTTEMKIWLNSL